MMTNCVIFRRLYARSGATKDARSDDPKESAQERPTDGETK
jgi:hypothetical protein